MTIFFILLIIHAILLLILTAGNLGSGIMTAPMIAFASSMIGRVSGRLAHTKEVMAMMFANASGYTVADVATPRSCKVPDPCQTWLRANSYVVTARNNALFPEAATQRKNSFSIS
jgi:TRAP-type C4-dicarboxylate transport system permease large subunit